MKNRRDILIVWRVLDCRQGPKNIKKSLKEVPNSFERQKIQ